MLQRTPKCKVCVVWFKKNIWGRRQKGGSGGESMEEETLEEEQIEESEAEKIEEEEERERVDMAQNASAANRAREKEECNVDRKLCTECGVVNSYANFVCLTH
jgi:hypothetical protein